jgi:hypothetical protein
METATISPKFQVVIPARPGEPWGSGRRFLKGIDATVERERDRA